MSEAESFIEEKPKGTTVYHYTTNVLPEKASSRFFWILTMLMLATVITTWVIGILGIWFADSTMGQYGLFFIVLICTLGGIWLTYTVFYVGMFGYNSIKRSKEPLSAKHHRRIWNAILFVGFGLLIMALLGGFFLVNQGPVGANAITPDYIALETDTSVDPNVPKQPGFQLYVNQYNIMTLVSTVLLFVVIDAALGQIFVEVQSANEPPAGRVKGTKTEIVNGGVLVHSARPVKHRSKYSARWVAAVQFLVVITFVTFVIIDTLALADVSTDIHKYWLTSVILIPWTAGVMALYVYAIVLYLGDDSLSVSSYHLARVIFLPVISFMTIALLEFILTLAWLKNFSTATPTLDPVFPIAGGDVSLTVLNEPAWRLYNYTRAINVFLSLLILWFQADGIYAYLEGEESVALA